jgi:hypothetical protein
MNYPYLKKLIHALKCTQVLKTALTPYPVISLPVQKRAGGVNNCTAFAEVKKGVRVFHQFTALIVIDSFL